MNTEIKSEYDELLRLLFETVYGRYRIYSDGEELKNHFYDNEEGLIGYFTRIFEECLNDPEYMRALEDGESYIKNMGTIYPMNQADENNDVSMDLLFVSMNTDEPNTFRLDFKERVKEQELFPYLNYSIEIGDDGCIRYNSPVKIDTNNKNGLTITPLDIEDTPISINNSIYAIQDIFIDIFNRCGIKDDEYHK